MPFAVKIVLITFNFIFLFLNSSGQSAAGKMTREEYIRQYKDIAIQEMKTYGIPASITLAQGVLESGDGNSELAVKANNHFGIKCHKEWNGKTYRMDDDKKHECFRKYKKPYESYKDHSYFLTQRDRYAFLFDFAITDYASWAHGLKKAGYATNPRYAHLLIKIIEENKLYEYDHYFDPDYTPVATVSEETPPVPITLSMLENESPIAEEKNSRKVYVNNKVKLIFAKKGDSFYQIAHDFNIYTFQVYKYNDLEKNDLVKEGQLLYLEKKKKKNPVPYHIVREGESMYSISQLYAVKLKSLYKHNKMIKGMEPRAGRKIWLQKRKG
ncbi:MAG: glucosaminidase domain-containing protein [Bacteroidales bacterium]|nr:glucosaminidase domain-containing protein [Bacteroidales bacterium]